jgi:hypothetical protein
MTKAEEKAERWRILVIFALAACIFASDILTPKGVSGEALYAGLVLIALWSPRPQLLVLVATGTSALTILGFFLSPAGNLSGNLVWMAIVNRVLAISAIWIAASLALLHHRDARDRERLILQLQDALAQVKTLQGLLPICASCKKVRDDRGYWSQIETYIGNHSGAEFTHGLCPECALKLYPEYFE